MAENKAQEYSDARKELIKLQDEYRILLSQEKLSNKQAEIKKKLYKDISSLERDIANDQKIGKNLAKDFNDIVQTTQARFAKILDVSHKIKGSDNERVKRNSQNNVLVSRAVKLAQIAENSAKGEGIYLGKSQTFRENIASMSSDLVDSMESNVQNSKKLGSEDFKQLDFAKKGKH